MAEHHIHRIRNSTAKAARIARFVVDLKTITTDDIADGVLRDAGARAALLRSILVRPQDRTSTGGGKPKVGEQRWKSASEEIWAQVEIIASCMLEEV